MAALTIAFTALVALLESWVFLVAIKLPNDFAVRCEFGCFLVAPVLRRLNNVALMTQRLGIFHLIVAARFKGFDVVNFCSNARDAFRRAVPAKWFSTENQTPPITQLAACPAHRARAAVGFLSPEFQRYRVGHRVYLSAGRYLFAPRLMPVVQSGGKFHAISPWRAASGLRGDGGVEIDVKA